MTSRECTIAVLVALMVGIAPATAQQAPPSLTSPPVDSFYPLELRPSAVTLPHDSVDVPLDIRDGRPMVMLTINGRGPFRFAVETGAPTITIRADVAHALGYTTADQAQWVQLDSVGIGDATFHHVHAKLFSKGASQSFGKGDLGGLLGLNVYYDLLLTLDPAHHRLRLTRGTLPPVNHRDVISIEPLGHQWYSMESAINGTHVMVFLDTQDPGAFRTTPSQVTDSQFVVPPIVIGYVGGPSLGRQPIKTGRFNGEIQVGPTHFPKPMANITPIPSEFLQRWIIGWNVLQHFTMTLDQRQRRLRLTSADTVIGPPPPLCDVGMDWEGNDSTGFRVVDVDSGGPADQQGLRAGDQLLSFNETTLTDATKSDLHEALKRPDAVRLHIRRGGDTRTMVLKPGVIVR